MLTRDRLDRPVDTGFDHVLGPPGAEVTLVEYGSYACPHCRAANERIAAVRDRFGDRMRYVFRQRPLTGSDIARRAADLAECARNGDEFWKAHVTLMSRSAELTEADLQFVAQELGVADAGDARARAAARVDGDIASARASGVAFTPTFFVNGRRYDGPWDESSLSDALLGSLGHRIRSAALDFAGWAPSAGVLLLLMSILAVLVSNSPWGAGFTAFWQQPWAVEFGRFGLRMPALDWVNHGLLSVFFLIVGLEIKREFTVGHLANRRSAAMPVAAALGGMIVPAALYALVIPAGSWDHGWGVPMATDTAFAVALIAMMGPRVPVALRIFLTAATIVDDIGAITVIALFYSTELHVGYLAAAAAVVAALALLNHAHVYRVTPYLLLGIALWVCVHGAGLHATLAGVILALFIPTRPPPDLNALMTQANALVAAEARRGGEVLRHGPSIPVLRALDSIHDRIESPADRLLRRLAPRSSYLVLPVFALANAGVVIGTDALAGHGPLMTAIACGLVIGKPLGMTLFCALAVAAGLAQKPAEYSWRQVVGAGALSGIGFTMSLFIAAQAFTIAPDFAAAKVAVFGASILAAVAGIAILWGADNSAPEASQGGTDMTLRIAMWSGPRNISTAMLRSFGSRPDTFVSDEPLYAHYLKVTGIAHPGRAEILAAHDPDWRSVAATLTGPVPDGKTVWYQKHMAHHLLPMIERDWLDALTHAFLIREPDEMVASLLKTYPDAGLGDTGLQQQCEIFDRVAERLGRAPPVVLASDVLKDPRAQLEALCEALGIPFLPAMLAWPPGRRETDGVWAPHWYAAVEASTGFEPWRRRHVELTPARQRLVDECRPWYEKLYALRLRA